MQDFTTIYMDETGNKESDRFFICGFLRIADNEQFINRLSRVREQIEARARFNKQQRVERLYEAEDIDTLYKLARHSIKFELKYTHVTAENIKFYQRLIKLLIREIDFKFDALVIDRRDPTYVHRDLKTMYKIITHLYFNKICTENCVFIPDSFDDYKWNWREILNNGNIMSIIPSSSHALFYLQVVDVLAGIIGQGLKDKEDYTNKDRVREPLVKLFQEETKILIEQNATVRSPKYINIWTIDFSKAKKKEGL